MRLTGGPAFPTLADNGHAMNQDGMTLRDYFAAKALPALLELWHKDLSAHGDPDFAGLNLTDNEGGTPDWVAEDAYAAADAMLRAREQ